MPDSPPNSETAPATGSTDRNPPRYRWLCRFAAAFLMLLVLAAVLRWRAGIHADARIAELLNSYRAAGEPITLDDMFPPDVPDEENAAPLILAAASLVELDPSVYESRERVSLNPEFIEPARRTLERNAIVLALLREARNRPACNWSPWERERTERPYSGKSLMEAADLLCLAAMVAVHDDDSVTALEFLLDALSLADALNERRFPALLCHVMAVQISMRVCRTIEQILPEVPLKAATDSDGMAARERVASLRDRLLDDTGYDEACIRAMYAERVYIIEMLIQSGVLPQIGSLSTRYAFADKPFGPLTIVSYPIPTVSIRQGLEMYTAQCLYTRDRVSGSKTLAKYPDLNCGGLLAKWESLFPCVLVTSFTGAIEQRCHNMGIRRLAAAGIAARLFESDHGVLPETIDTLIPEYLPDSPARMPGSTIYIGSDPSGSFIAADTAITTMASLNAAASRVFRLSKKNAYKQHDIDDKRR